MKIIIAGAGNVGTHLAKLLSREKQDIILMDDDEEKLTALSSNFDLLTVTASPSSISGLKEVGVKEADLFIAVTPDEVRRMKRSDCLVMISGEAPVRDKKYNLFDHVTLVYSTVTDLAKFLGLSTSNPLFLAM